MISLERVLDSAEFKAQSESLAASIEQGAEQIAMRDGVSIEEGRALMTKTLVVVALSCAFKSGLLGPRRP